MSVVLSTSAPVEYVHHVQDARSKFDAVFAEISPDHFKNPELIKALLKNYSEYKGA